MVIGLFLPPQSQQSPQSRQRQLCFLLDVPEKEVSELPELPSVTEHSRQITVTNCIETSIAIARITDELLKNRVLEDHATEIDRQIRTLGRCVLLMVPTHHRDPNDLRDETGYMLVRTRLEQLQKLDELKFQMQSESRTHMNTLLELQEFVNSTVGAKFTVEKLEALFNAMPDNELISTYLKITETFQIVVDILNWLSLDNFYLRTEFQDVFRHIQSIFGTIYEEVRVQFSEIDKNLSNELSTKPDYISRIKGIIDRFCNVLSSSNMQNQYQVAKLENLVQLFDRMISCMSEQMSRCVNFKSQDKTSTCCMFVDNVDAICVKIVNLRESLRKIQEAQKEQERIKMIRNQEAGRVVKFQADRKVPFQILGSFETDLFPDLAKVKDTLNIRVANSFWGGGVARESMKLLKSLEDSQASVLHRMLESARIAARGRRIQQKAIAAPESAAVVSFGSAAPVSSPVSQAVGEGDLHNFDPLDKALIDNLDEFDKQVDDVGGSIRSSSLPERREDQPLVSLHDVSLFPEMPGLAGQRPAGSAQGGPAPGNILMDFFRKGWNWATDKVLEPLDRITGKRTGTGGSIKKRNNRLDNHKITRSNKKNKDNTSSSVPKTKKIVKLQKKRKFTIKIKPKDALSEQSV